MGWRVLVTAKAFWRAAAEGQEALQQAGCTLVPVPEGVSPRDEGVASLLQGCDAVIASMETYDAAVFAAAPSLKHVSRCGVGYDAINVPAATEAGVIVTNTPGAMVDAVAEFTVGLIIASARRIAELDRAMHQGRGFEYQGVLVGGKTLGLVGFGQIGRLVADRMRGFGMRILACDPCLPAGPVQGAEIVALDRLLREADFVSLHAPSTPETAGMIGAAQLALMKPTAHLINTARGALVDESALVEALRAERIAGAALDVTAVEPLPLDHPLRTTPHTILTAHNAFNAAEAAKRMCNMAAQNVLTLVEGARPWPTLNPEVFDSPALRAQAPQGGWKCEPTP